MGGDAYGVRPAAEGELLILMEIERAAAALFGGTRYAEFAELEPYTASLNPERDRVWVATGSENHPVAFAVFYPTETTVHLQEIDVHPAHARRGVGRLLIEALAQWAGSNGKTAITLTTFRDIPWNAPYYERLGFRALDPGEFSAELRTIWEEEKQYGFPKGSRVCMRREV